MPRSYPEINAGSTADIAFLLLIFFLVTSTMGTDKGLTRMLPPPLDSTSVAAPPVKERNVFPVLINSKDLLMVNGKPGSIETLRAQTRTFLLNPNDDPNLSEHPRLSERLSLTESERIAYEILGDVNVSRGVISLQNDRETSYEMYIKVQNELVAAINQIRDEMSLQYFGVKCDQLKNKDGLDAIRTAVPMRISEAEPKNVGGKQ